MSAAAQTPPAATPSIEKLDLSAHDFDLPCGITKSGVPCDKAADWWAQFESDHAETTFDRLLCPDHYDYVMSGGTGRCVRCETSVVFKDHLLRIERIKP